MSIKLNERCECCLEVKKFTATDSCNGFYCPDCLRVKREEINNALKEIRDIKKKSRERNM